jgi:hypothetical protein
MCPYLLYHTVSLLRSTLFCVCGAGLLKCMQHPSPTCPATSQREGGGARTTCCSADVFAAQSDRLTGCLRTFTVTCDLGPVECS